MITPKLREKCRVATHDFCLMTGNIRNKPFYMTLLFRNNFSGKRIVA